MKRINKKINKFLKLKIFLILMAFGGYANASYPECGREYLAEAVEYNNPLGLDWIIENCKEALSLDVYLNKDERTTALMWTVRGENLEMAQTLFRAGANPSAQNNEGKTVLMLAVETGNLEIVKAVIAALASKADLSLKDNEGKTALIHAVERGYLEGMEALIAAGADLSIQDNKGKTALIYAVETGILEVVETVIAAGADLSIRDKDGRTVLMLAVKTGNLEILDVLYTAGATKLDLRDNGGFTALRIAIEYAVLIRVSDVAIRENLEIVKFFINKGADLDLPDNIGSTILIWLAEWHRHLNVLEVLNLVIAAGAKLDLRNKNGRTALMYAVWNEHLEVVEIVIAAGADPSIRDNEGNTALEL